MQNYEYKVIAAPRKARRAKGAKTGQDRFARTLTDVINTEAASGWEYLRAESLPVDEKKGMLSSATESYHSVLVFRKAKLQPATPRVATQTSQAAVQSVSIDPPKPSPMPLGPATTGD